MCRKAQSDDETFVSEYLLIVTEDRVCELRVENLGCSRLVVSWLDQGELDCIVGIAGPYQDGVSSK